MGDVYQGMLAAGRKSDSSGNNDVAFISGKSVHVTPPIQVPGNASHYNITTPTNTRQTQQFTAAIALILCYDDLTGGTPANGQYLKYVLNADSDADAIGKLATANGFATLTKNNSHAIAASPDTPIKRIDFQTAVAAGTDSTLFSMTVVQL